jgi:beta-glucosidase
MPGRDRITSPEGIVFRDLNGNGVMEPYENPALPADERVADLLTRMTLDDKAGLMMMSILETGPHGDIVEGEGHFPNATSTLTGDKRMNHFNALRLPGPRYAARWNNLLQDMAAQTPLGIPVTLYTDPRHSFAENIGAALAADAFSQWPEALGFGAIGDPELVERFADIARQEYLAVGIRGALHPQIDLATEPRWARAAGGFGGGSANPPRPPNAWSPPICGAFRASGFRLPAWRAWPSIFPVAGRNATGRTRTSLTVASRFTPAGASNTT